MRKKQKTRGTQRPIARQQPSQPKGNLNAGGNVKKAPQKKQSVQQNQRPIIPFLRGDRILLIGEGDFSFARSLATQYKCRNICATCYDSQEMLFGKYPQAEQFIQDIQAKPNAKLKSSDSDESDGKEQQPTEIETSNPRSSYPKVLFSIDARKLGVQGGGGKEVKIGFPRRERKRPAWKTQQQSLPPQGGPWDVICFNFPHVGGLSTDVNRQVRANQDLLVKFFKACIPLLSTAPEPADSDDEWEDDDDEENEDEEDPQTSGKSVRTGPGQILVSLFEGEPYTLWNIKDLARHAGLQVVTSFRFPWTSYQGYSHARTLGEVEGKDGGRGGWRGEDREARMYVFEVKPQEDYTGKKKRGREDSSDSE
ncbi:hypothetical protein N7495_008946 [Penicillium taxi]|uniref:uncharacterized protein n=1 Tax=Penicillium taxi TaxID=168475 RepID=UPI002545B3E7|nr:uncharacterized protein N7495_008946 [Penicillium taxi]KAJ5888905.1 hypothetical protein N7495_008946 [Penicillium taxi]